MSESFVFAFIAGLLLVTIAGFFFWQRKSPGYPLRYSRKVIQRQKEKNKQKIIELFDKQNEIKNDDVEELLNVSDSTATNYLDELESERKIQQQGDTGRGVFYTKINGQIS